MIPRDETSPPASKSKRASTRSILHVDMDAFFASVEALDDPSLLGKPVVVGMPPEERGVVAAASYEARRYGVHSAMSMHQALKLCPQAIVVRPRGRRYREISRQIFDIFRHYTPLVEPVSIDEAFLDVTASRRLFGTPEQIGHEIKRRIRDEIGLTASVGIAPNKYLAKLASDLKKPDGFVVIAENQIEEILAGLPVRKLWGVGPKSEAALARLGIHLVRDLLAYPAETLARHLGDSAWELLALARGIDDRPVVTEGETKSISAETTFARDLRDSEALTKELDGLADEVAQRLRREGFRARTMTLKARYPRFHDRHPLGHAPLAYGKHRGGPARGARAAPPSAGPDGASATAAGRGGDQSGTRRRRTVGPVPRRQGSPGRKAGLAHGPDSGPLWSGQDQARRRVSLLGDSRFQAVQEGLLARRVVVVQEIIGLEVVVIALKLAEGFGRQLLADVLVQVCLEVRMLEPLA